jgi:hypothetical protein
MAMALDAEKWIRFLRQYGPVPRNANMYDEEIRRWSKRLNTDPIEFEHPLLQKVLAAFTERKAGHGGAIVLTGTAGDGKSYLCYKVWEALGGPLTEWAADDSYFRFPITLQGQQMTLHVIRDLTPLPEIDPAGRYSSKGDLLQSLSGSLFEPSSDLFLVAANDGQLIENWRRLGSHGPSSRALDLFEARLMNDDDPHPTDRLHFFNLSDIPSARMFELALSAFIAHPGWRACYEAAGPNGLFSPGCPIRHNYQLLNSPLVRSRLTALFRLCDYNELHTPIRRILLLLANAVLGHPDVKDSLMTARDAAKIIANGTANRASLYGNLFGANLTATRRESQEIFQYLERFGIGYETTNRIDNILIFGAEDENLRDYYKLLVEDDSFYGATDRYRAEQKRYIEMPEANNGDRHHFLDMLVEQRRGLFLKIPDALADELKLWSLTVFISAGEYLKEIAEPLRNDERIPRSTISRLVKGLNRVFTGMLVATDRELLLATSLTHSGARMSQLLEDRIAINARGRQEKIEVVLLRDFPYLVVTLPNGNQKSLALNLTRYEFLMRVSDGALPGNFSRECYEDILAFKSALLTESGNEHDASDQDGETDLCFRLLSLDAYGNAVEDTVEVANV